MARKVEDIVLCADNQNVLKLTDFLSVLNFKMSEYNRKSGFDPNYKVLTAQPGSKYIKIVETLRGGQRSVYCFLDYEGNIYKSATWRAPAKYVRGNVFQTDCSWGQGLGPYGAAYLR